MTDICGVYIIKSLESGRVYVGSSQKVMGRIKQHIKLLNARKHHNDDMIDEWEKFGQKKFDFELLEKCRPEERKAKEFAWCMKYKAFEAANGFNKNKPASYNNLEPAHLLVNCMALIKIPGGSKNLFTFLSWAMNSRNVLFFNRRDRKIAASALGCSLSAINNKLSTLMKGGYIRKLNDGSYEIEKTVVKWGKYQKSTYEDLHFKATKRKYIDITPTPSAVPSTQYEDDASDIDPETGEVLKNV